MEQRERRSERSPDERSQDERSQDERSGTPARNGLGPFVREQRRLAELSLRRLADLSGVSNPYLSQIERGLRVPSAEVLRQLAPALGVPAETLYVRAGLLDAPAVTVDLVTLIRDDPALTEAQKRTLVHIYESFRAGADPERGDARPASVRAGGESSGRNIG